MNEISKKVSVKKFQIKDMTNQKNVGNIVKKT